MKFPSAGYGHRSETKPETARLPNINRVAMAPLLRLFLVVTLLSAIFTSCSVTHGIRRAARKHLFTDSTLRQAHVGIALYDPAAEQFLFQHNAEKYFVPASNTKIVSCYAAMKHLGDSLPGLYYLPVEQGLLLKACGDPTLLHPDFFTHPVLDFLKRQNLPLWIQTDNWTTSALGRGWSWDDYNYSYMGERSGLPVYGNAIRWYQERGEGPSSETTVYSLPEINWKVRFDPKDNQDRFSVQRDRTDNVYVITQGKESRAVQEVPFVTHGYVAALELLKDTLGQEIREWTGPLPAKPEFRLLHSQPTDSLLKIMMHRSDNFFAEQTLQMVSQRMLGYMNDQQVTDTLLKTDFSGLPHKPAWADGSGLSRYNLFTPADFVFILHKMRNEFGFERIKSIFPGGGQGTLSNLYVPEAGRIYAKTGTLSGVVCLSGYLQTQRGKWIMFSVMINNHRGSAPQIRQQIQQFLRAVSKRS